MEFVFFVWVSEQAANFALCNTKRLVFITEVESVYSAVRTESLYTVSEKDCTLFFIYFFSRCPLCGEWCKLH